MLSYHNKLRLKKWLRRGAITLAVLLVGFLVVLIYAAPYMIYSREGATFDPQATIEPTQTPRETTPRPEVKNPNIIYDADVVDAASVQELGGYYISTEMLRDPQTVLNSVKQLTKPCTVLIDIKSVFGNFYYSSAVSGASVADGDITACDEEEGNVFVSALKHTVKIALMLVAVNIALNLLFSFIGVERLSGTFLRHPLLGSVTLALFGLIPNCSVSVVLTQTYLSGVIGVGGLFAGLLSNAGIGLLVLYRTNRNTRENLWITGFLFAASAASGIVITLLSGLF